MLAEFLEYIYMCVLKNKKDHVSGPSPRRCAHYRAHPVLRIHCGEENALPQKIAGLKAYAGHRITPPSMQNAPRLPCALLIPEHFLDEPFWEWILQTGDTG